MRHNNAEDRNDRETKLLMEGKKRYIWELKKQLHQLRQWSALSDQDPEAAFATPLFRTVHSLKGSAPMFGFVRIGLIAEKLVYLWEWAADEIPGLPEGVSLEQHYKAAVYYSQPLLEQLELETAVYAREMELDEHQNQLQRTLFASAGERLLVIDDDEVLRSYLVRRLKLDGYEVDEAADVPSAEKLLRERTYQLVTLDLMMHPESGYELFEYLKEDPTLKWTPLIVLSGREDVGDKVRCFYLGADDYVTKPFQYEELHARIYSLLKRTRTFEQLAFRDPLTGVYNRRFFDHQVQVELQRMRRFPAPISLVFIDIDRFKSINDTYGHHIGDLVLQGLAHLLQNHLRSTDLLARFGGEEFVIVLPGSSEADAKRMLEAILQQTHTGPIAQNEGQSIYITFSAGVSEWRPGMPVEEWIRRSDHAMYEAKQTGRNKVVLYQASAGEEKGEQTPPAVVRKRAVIADDDRILRSILIAKLKHLPIDFIEAVDGEEAYLALLSQSIDLCILDGVMPKLDGYGVLERMKEQGNRPAGTRVLILSGRSRDEDINRGLQLGADGYMHKPFSMVELELKVKELLAL
ncbi:diguanylate cyclase [Paenibacillus filicis]|uniref:Diguanylate cyclase n=1 Tax=Paenibacillus gyeongsangnamensis TaxID=3388067 RepID=A0ABT4QHH3_9BACL|nr:diguanylate cyclase [Paenibacillus filicis]MCZ8516323.1 diguanylate cyclase [Paenibacillus filicis]